MTVEHQIRMHGEQQIAYGTGFTPGETVTGTQLSAPFALGTQVANAQGEVSFTWRIPASTVLGVHRVELSGPESGSAFADFRVVAADAGIKGPRSTTPGGGLAVTGFEPGGVVPIALVVLAAGTVLLIASRRGWRTGRMRD